MRRFLKKKNCLKKVGFKNKEQFEGDQGLHCLSQLKIYL